MRRMSWWKVLLVFQHSRPPRTERSKVKKDDHWCLWRKTSKGFRTKRKPKGYWSSDEQWACLVHRKKQVLEEKTQANQSPPALEVGPRQTLLQPFVGWGWPADTITTSGFWKRLLLPSGAQVGQSLRRQWTANPALLWEPAPAASGRGPWWRRTGAGVRPQAPRSEAGEWGGRGDAPELRFRLDHSVRDDGTRWARTCSELRCVAHTRNTNLGHACVTNHVAPLQSVDYILTNEMIRRGKPQKQSQTPVFKSIHIFFKHS